MQVFFSIIKHHYFKDHIVINTLQKGKKEPTTNRLAALLFKLCDYNFDIRYWQDEKMFITDPLCRLNIERIGDIHAVKTHNYYLS